MTGSPLLDSGYEGLPLPVIGALSTGGPAVVPITGGCQDLAGDAARHVDPLNPDSIAETILTVAGSPELRQQMRLTGVERAKEFP